MNPTMKDVAEKAGVALGTVSRYFNGGMLKEGTRAKVENAIAELKFEPNQYARGLKADKTKTIALILPTIWHPFYSEFAYFVETKLEKAGFKLFLCNSDNNPEKEKEYIKLVKQNKVDGIIGITYADIDPYVSSELPFVSIDRHFSEDVTYVTADNYIGGQIAAKELIDRGSSKLAFIGSQLPYHSEMTNREKGFSEYCEEVQVPFKTFLMAEPIVDELLQIEDFFSKHPDVDGIFSINDMMGINILRVLEKMGRKVPDEIQLIGFDGIKLERNSDFLISTIQQPVDLMAEMAVTALISQIKGVKEESRFILPVTFIAGKTTNEKKR